MVRTIKEIVDILKEYPQDMPIYINGTLVEEGELTKYPRGNPFKPFQVEFWPYGDGYIVLRTIPQDAKPNDILSPDIPWED